MFAVVKISGKQYEVKKGDVLEVSYLEGEVGDTITIPEVLLVGDDKGVKIGNPTVAKMTVTAKIVSQGKGEKLEIGRYKQKVRHRRHIGFRPLVTKLEISGIGNA